MLPFVIWFQHRSGSTHLVSLLNSHNEIKCKGEIFGCQPIANAIEPQPDSNARLFGNRWYRRVLNQFPGRIYDPDDQQTCQEFEDFFVARRQYPAMICGFKFKFPSQQNLYPEISGQLIRNRNQLRLIELSRKNLLRRAISVLNLEKVQQETQRANVEHRFCWSPQVYDISEIVRLIEYYQKIEGEFSEWCEQFPHRLSVDYGDLVADQESVARQIQRFVGVKEIAKLTSKTQKISPVDLSQQILNYDELVNALTRRGYAGFLS